MTIMTDETTSPVGEPLPAEIRDLLAKRVPAAVDAVRWHARSGTRLDTGGWFGRTTVHAVVLADRLALVASGPRPFVLDMPLTSLRKAVYNHVTGAVSFPPSTAGPAVPAVRLDPLAARTLLALAPSLPNTPSGKPSHA